MHGGVVVSQGAVVPKPRRGKPKDGRRSSRLARGERKRVRASHFEWRVVDDEIEMSFTLNDDQPKPFRDRLNKHGIVLVDIGQHAEGRHMVVASAESWCATALQNRIKRCLL